ncbi:UDP-phosphate glycosyltransferase [Cryobacterium suzukii]|uniref:UDP-phosphate glycosyltransferase n=1 Tax=Cryobacterium suzukii TaxID=1259198 RepID=A0A4R9AK18_9MICO|nr:UDP-phosphate glycosyltransferase [Cryobacterium suzukii]TFD63146.1 UDP-phosphate glycosyltransferase [Cryobacterium suzukii]
MILFIVITLAAVLVVSLLAPAVLKPILLRMGVIDVPNSRSLHSHPVVRGVGLAPLMAILVGYGILLIGSPDSAHWPEFIVIVSVSLAAGLLGLAEDIRGLAVVVRAGGQLAIGLVGAFAIAAYIGGSWWAAALYAVGIAGYINAANFMDGVNGISGLHGTVVGAAYGALGIIADAPWLTAAGWILAVAFAGFLPWNLMHGGMFLGDVGSYLLGGGIAIIAAAAIARGVPIVAVVGPVLIYLADTGMTLLGRVLRGERWFEAHRGHAYQRLANLGLSHLQVASIVTMAGVGTASLGLMVAVSPETWGVAVVLMILTATGYLSFASALGGSHRRDAARGDGSV